MNLDELRERVKARKESDQVTLEELSKILNIGIATLKRFLRGGNLQQRTIKLFEQYADGRLEFKVRKRDHFLPKLRVSEAVANYFKTEAEKNNESISSTVNKYLLDIVENDYLVEEFNKHITMTERALENLIEKNLMPYMKIINANYDNVQISLDFMTEIIMKYGEMSISDQDKVAIFDHIADRFYKEKRKKKGSVE